MYVEVTSSESTLLKMGLPRIIYSKFTVLEICFSSVPKHQQTRSGLLCFCVSFHNAEK